VVDEAMEGEIQVTVIATGFETTQPLTSKELKTDYLINPYIIIQTIKKQEPVFLSF